jgi:hypothetical protein
MLESPTEKIKYLGGERRRGRRGNREERKGEGKERGEVEGRRRREGSSKPS